MLDELLERLQARAGLSREQAQKAVDVFADFMENKMTDEQLREFAGKVPGLGRFSEKLPENLGDKLGGAARGLFRKKD